MMEWGGFWGANASDFCSPGVCYICDEDCEAEAGHEFFNLMTLEAVKASA